MRSAAGLTLVEVIVTVAILALLLGLAAPSFTPLLERWRVQQAAGAMTSTMQLARSEAIKRGGNIIIQANTNTDWGTGWHVFFDVNADRSQDPCDPDTTPNECDLQVVGAPTALEIELPSSTLGILVDRWGMISHTGSASNTSTAMAFEFKPKGKTLEDNSATKLCINQGGGLTQKKGSATC